MVFIPSDHENKNINAKYRCPKCNGMTGTTKRKRSGNTTLIYKYCNWCQHMWDEKIVTND